MYQPEKSAQDINQTRLTFNESSAPQDSRKIKKTNLLPTRNEMNEISVKESLESA